MTHAKHSSRRRSLLPWLIIAALVAALALALYLRAQAPPEAARLLPESDAILYIRLKDLRSATHFDQTPVTRSPDFQHFIDATGIVPERDLDSVAFALHHMPDPRGPNGPVAYSEVFIGRFDGEKLARYLHSLAASEEIYAGRTVYSIPVEGRTLRVAQLAYDTVAASNMPTAEQIHSMLDRGRASALGTPGSSLLAARYHQVPLLSEAWGIGHIGLPFAQHGYINAFGLQLPIAADTDLIASLRYSGAAHLLHGGSVDLRIEEIAPDAVAAHHTVESLTTLLSLLRAVGDAQPPHDAADAAMRNILAGTTLDQHESHATLNATATLDQLKTIFNSKSPDASLASPGADAASK